MQPSAAPKFVYPVARQGSRAGAGNQVAIKLEKEGSDLEPGTVGCSTLKLVLWFGAVLLLIGAVVGLSVVLVVIKNNKPPPPPSPPAPRSPPNRYLTPPPRPPPPAPATPCKEDDFDDGGSCGGGGGGDAPPAPAGGMVVPKGLPPFVVAPGWRALWWDEFEESTLDTSKWNYDRGNSEPGMAWGWGNNELEWYTSSGRNVGVQAGKLSLTALQEPYFAPWGEKFNYTSGRINTRNKAWAFPGMQTSDGTSYSTVRIEASIRTPRPGQGLWPAFWAYPQTLAYGAWPASGEIDVMETINEMDAWRSVIHFGGPDDKRKDAQPIPVDMSARFYSYAVEWSLDSIKFSLDGEVMHEIQSSVWFSTDGASPAPFDKAFFLILNLAVGGKWANSPDDSTPFPAVMQIDHVRILGYPSS